jgi:hypothetical protein
VIAQSKEERSDNKNTEPYAYLSMDGKNLNIFRFPEPACKHPSGCHDGYNKNETEGPCHSVPNPAGFFVIGHNSGKYGENETGKYEEINLMRSPFFTVSNRHEDIHS